LQGQSCADLQYWSSLVLAEATNSLDSENSTSLRAIERVQGKVTVVIIAHRLSTIRWADLNVIEAGRIVESGNWSTLSGKLDGRFRSWCMAQGLAA
jgi:ATP-binding cassette subfamily C protein